MLAMQRRHLSLQIWKTLRPPCLQPTRSTPPTIRDPPRSFVRAQLQCRAPCRNPGSSFHTRGPVPMIEQPRLGSNIRHLPQARQPFSIGLCVCVKGLHCVPPQVSTSQFFPPIGQFVQSSTSPGWHRPPDLAVHRPASNLAGLTGLTSRESVHRAYVSRQCVLPWFTTRQLNGCSRSKDSCSLTSMANVRVTRLPCGKRSTCGEKSTARHAAAKVHPTSGSNIMR